MKTIICRKSDKDIKLNYMKRECERLGLFEEVKIERPLPSIYTKGKILQRKVNPNIPCHQLVETPDYYGYEPIWKELRDSVVLRYKYLPENRLFCLIKFSRPIKVYIDGRKLFIPDLRDNKMYSTLLDIFDTRLPEEVLNIIMKYLPNKINVKLKTFYNPFSPYDFVVNVPRWMIVNDVAKTNY